MEGVLTMDFISYIIGLIKGRKEGTQNVVLEGDSYTFTDPNNDGNVVMEKGV